MAQNSYALFKQSEVFYWFISTGPNGDIPKGVFLTPADVPAVSNPFTLTHIAASLSSIVKKGRKDC